MDYSAEVRQQLLEASEVLEKFIQEPVNFKKIETAARMIVNAIEKGGKVFSCGNGGSLCDAMHFAEELTGRFRNERKPLPAIAISDPTHFTCVANDYDFNAIFSRYIEGLGNKNDILLCISTSGNSGNIIKAVEAAKTKGMNVIGLTGKDGGILASKADLEIRVPHFGFSDRIQEIHIKIIHILILLIEKMIS